MNAVPDSQSTLLAENRFQWRQPIADYLEAKQASPGVIEKIERLAIASPYALQQLQRAPELIDSLTELKKFTLDPEIIGVVTDR